MAAKQRKKSKSWAISAGAVVGRGKGAVGASLVFLTLFDVENQLYIPLSLKGGSVGGGLPFAATASTFSPSFFSTSKPLWASAFNGRTTMAGAELTLGVGGSLSYITFWGVDHDPYWLDVGGLQVGISGGVGAGIWNCTVETSGMKENNGCIIDPGGDPLCGGSSSGGNSSQDPGMSRAN